MGDEAFERHVLTLASHDGSAGEGSAWARALAERSQLPHARIDALDLCIVELVTNVVNHSYRGAAGQIRLELGLDPAAQAAMLTVIDEGPAFDPLSVPAPVMAASLEEATIGGLGVHLVRSSADRCQYQRSAGRNVFTVWLGASA
jgi:anti-sigma regulatory factor (Ser/Thr protein kinase)